MHEFEICGDNLFQESFFSRDILTEFYLKYRKMRKN